MKVLTTWSALWGRKSLRTSKAGVNAKVSRNSVTDLLVSPGRLRKFAGSPFVDGSGDDGFETLNAAPGQPYPNSSFCRRTLARRVHDTWPRGGRSGHGAPPDFYEGLITLA